MDASRTLILLVLIGLCCGCATSADLSESDNELEAIRLDSQSPEFAIGSTSSTVAFFVEGTIADVEDGDTVTIKAVNESEYLIRMSDMDTPEIFHKAFRDRRTGEMVPERPGQKHGKAAHESLAELASIGSSARADCYELDYYGRMVCHVITAAGNLNLIQIERGWGMLPRNADWIRDPKSGPAEQMAREARIGVWAESNPTHPDDWRKKCWKQGSCPDPEGP